MTARKRTDPDPPWDRDLATKATVIEQMKRLGGVALDSHRKKAGFDQPDEREPDRGSDDRPTP